MKSKMKKTRIIGLFAVFFVFTSLISVYSLNFPGGINEPIRSIDEEVGIDNEQVGIEDGSIGVPGAQQGILGRVRVLISDAVDGIVEIVGVGLDQIRNLFLPSISSNADEFLKGAAKKSSTIYVSSGSRGKVLLATKENTGLHGEDAVIIARYKNVEVAGLCQILIEDAKKNDYQAGCAHDPDNEEYTFWAFRKDLDEEQEKRFWDFLASANRLR